MINKNFLEEPNIVDLAREIFKEVVQNKLEIDTRFTLLSDDLYEAETINFVPVSYTHLTLPTIYSV